jgi:hypothetical protein
MAIKADRSLFNRLLKAMAKGEPLPKGTFPEAEKSSRKGVAQVVSPE